MSLIVEFFKAFAELFIEMAPYLLLGFLIAGVLHVFLPASKMTKFLGKSNFKAVINAALFGIPLPLCSCGVIPTGISLYKNGASKGSTVSFLISTPQTGVDSILATYGVLGMPFALIRVVVAFLAGLIGGELTNLSESKNKGETKNTTPEASAPVEGNKLVAMVRYALDEFLMDIAKWLLVGLVIAAAITVLIPDSLFTEYLTNEYLGMVVVLLLSVPMYVCATGSIPIALALMAKGISPGAAFVFLMAGPATNAATITVVGKTLGNKTLWSYLIAIFVLAILGGVIINEFLPASWFLVNDIGHALHEHGDQNFIGYLSAIILSVALIRGYWIKIKKKQKAKEDLKNMDTTKSVFKVDGMTCKHCEANVLKAAQSVPNAEEVKVSLENGVVSLKGTYSEEDLKKAVEDAGYDFKGKA